MNKPGIEFVDPPKIPDCGLEKVKDAIDATMGIPERLRGCENKSCILATFW